MKSVDNQGVHIIEIALHCINPIMLSNSCVQHTYGTVHGLWNVPWALHSPVFPSVVHELIGRIIFKMLFDGFVVMARIF